MKAIILLFFLVIFYLIIILKRNKEMMNFDDTVTVEWIDPHLNCKRFSKSNCDKNNCKWLDLLKKKNGICVSNSNPNLNNNELDAACDLYNFKELDNYPFFKSKGCKSIGCNLINSSTNKKLCVSPEFNSHTEYCKDENNEYSCSIKKKYCNWNKEINECIPYKLNSNQICRNINYQYDSKNKCKILSRKKNTNNCFVNNKYNDNYSIVFNTGLDNFKRKKCIENKCNFMSLLNNNKGLCVSPEIKSKDDFCFTFLNQNEINNNNCHQIGCKHTFELNKNNNGICFNSDSFINKNNKMINYSKICEYANNKKDKKNFCQKIGCQFNYNKNRCYYKKPPIEKK